MFFPTIVVFCVLFYKYSIYKIEKIKQEINTAASKINFDHDQQIETAYIELESIYDALRKFKRINVEKAERTFQELNHFQSVLSSMREGVLSLDKEGKIVNINEAAKKLLLRNVNEEVIGKYILEVIRSHELQEFIKETFVTNTITDKEIVSYSPKKTVFRITCLPLKNIKDEIVGSLIVFLDITDLKRLEDVRRDFVSNVSHELRTPITSIKGFVETLLEGDLENTEETRRFLNIVSKHTSRLEMIIQELLQLDQIEDGIEKGDLEKTELDIVDLFLNVITLAKSQADEKKIKLISEVSVNTQILANRYLIEQAVLNLIYNAIKYSPEGSEVILSAKTTKACVKISVKDYGSGIPLEHQKRVFERFYRVDKSRNRKEGGTGLGLSIVKNIAVIHGGEVGLVSEPGRGSDFYLQLPLS